MTAAAPDVRRGVTRDGFMAFIRKYLIIFIDFDGR